MILFKILSFFFGFLLSSIIDTTLGELNEWAIVGASVIVASVESFSSNFFKVKYYWKRGISKRKQIYLLLNDLKLGIIYGLIVDAFKLGS
jgi:hypothetical protein